MQLQSAAKINLFLHVIGQRKDGYHNLQTAFQFLNIFDTLIFEKSAGNHIRRIDQHEFEIPEEDLVIKAANRLLKENGISAIGLDITLRKVIPPGSGMGGGSSNAATTLIGLNRLLNLGNSKQQLLKIASSLGADVAVFIHGKSTWASGIGDQFLEFTPPEQWLLICVPNINVPTAAIFNHPDLCRNRPSIDRQEFLNHSTSNDLQPITRKLFAEVNDAMKTLEQFGETRMNGSGSSIFTLCESRAHAKDVQVQLPGEYKTWIAKTQNRFSP